MKFLVVNVNATTSMTETIAESARAVSATGTEVGGLVVESVTAAVKFAESLVGLGLSTSKARTYASPRRKRIGGWPLTRDLFSGEATP